jgi:predicted DNA-binding transcriptional regulator AlpA
MHKLPETGFVRLPQIVGNPKADIPALIPISKSTWWQGVRTGRFPQPVKLGPRTTVWRVEDIRDLIARTSIASGGSRAPKPSGKNND